MLQKLRHFFNIFAAILHACRAAIDMKLIKQDFSLKAWVQAPWVHRPSIKIQLWYISYLFHLYLHLLSCCCICDSVWMQHGHVLKNLYFSLLTPRLGRGVCGGNICYHVAALVIPFNLICKKKKWPCFEKVNFYIWPHPQGLFMVGGVWRQKNCYHICAFVI